MRSSWPLPTTSPRHGQVQADTSAGPARPAPASSARLRLGQTTSRSWTQRATTPTPTISTVRRPAIAALPDLASARHSGRRNARIPDAHTGHRTREAGQRTPERSDARTGHRTPVAGQASVDTGRTGHWTPDAGRRCGQGDDDTAASGPPGPPRRAIANWNALTVFLWTAPPALASQAGSPGRRPAGASLPLAQQAASVASPAKARLGALLSCVGWYEGRAMGLRKGEGVRGRVGEAMLMAVLQ